MRAPTMDRMVYMQQLVFTTVVSVPSLLVISIGIVREDLVGLSRSRSKRITVVHLLGTSFHHRLLEVSMLLVLVTRSSIISVNKASMHPLHPNNSKSMP